jgi:hypothetical protein
VDTTGAQYRYADPLWRDFEQRRSGKINSTENRGSVHGKPLQSGSVTGILNLNPIWHTFVALQELEVVAQEIAAFRAEFAQRIGTGVLVEPLDRRLHQM